MYPISLDHIGLVGNPGSALFENLWHAQDLKLNVMARKNPEITCSRKLRPAIRKKPALFLRGGKSNKTRMDL
jgi:hypothetical protein